MGAINYFTSDYITLGLKPYDTMDFLNDADFLECARENGIDTESESDLHDYATEIIQDYYQDDYSNIEHILKKYNFYYFHVTIQYGYYEGFTLDIENNFSVAFDDYLEKREAQKEATLLKQCLIECAGCGLVECFPSWCTGYSDYKDTLKGINKAIKEIREEIKSTPTWLYYNANRSCRKAV